MILNEKIYEYKQASETIKRYEEIIKTKIKGL